MTVQGSIGWVGTISRVSRAESTRRHWRQETACIALAIRFENLGAVQPEVDRLEESLCRMSSADGLEPVVPVHTLDAVRVEVITIS
jgi:hypothetical protein